PSSRSRSTTITALRIASRPSTRRPRSKASFNRSAPRSGWSAEGIAMKFGRDRIIRKSAGELDKMRRVGRLVGEVLRDLRAMVAPGVTTLDLDRYAEKMTREAGGIPAFIGVPGMRNAYRHTICASINEEVVHGIPSDRKLVEGDIVGIDFGIILDGYVGDSAFTVPVGTIADDVKA